MQYNENYIAVLRNQITITKQEKEKAIGLVVWWKEEIKRRETYTCVTYRRTAPTKLNGIG